LIDNIIRAGLYDGPIITNSEIKIKGLSIVCDNYQNEIVVTELNETLKFVERS